MTMIKNSSGVHKKCPLCHASLTFHPIIGEYRCNGYRMDDSTWHSSCGWFTDQAIKDILKEFGNEQV